MTEELVPARELSLDIPDELMDVVWMHHQRIMDIEYDNREAQYRMGEELHCIAEALAPVQLDQYLTVVEMHRRTFRRLVNVYRKLNQIEPVISQISRQAQVDIAESALCDELCAMIQQETAAQTVDITPRWVGQAIGSIEQHLPEPEQDEPEPEEAPEREPGDDWEEDELLDESVSSPPRSFREDPEPDKGIEDWDRALESMLDGLQRAAAGLARFKADKGLPPVRSCKKACQELEDALDRIAVLIQKERQSLHVGTH